MAKKEDKFQTEIWKKYEKCKKYAEKKNIVQRTEKNWNFSIACNPLIAFSKSLHICTSSIRIKLCLPLTY